MKRIIVLFLIASMVCVVHAQKGTLRYLNDNEVDLAKQLTPEVRLLKPIPENYFKAEVSHNLKAGIAVAPSEWFLRLTVGAVTTRNTYDKVSKQWATTPMSAVGMGVAYKHYIALTDGTPYNNYGFNLLLLTSVKLFDQEQTTIGVGLFATFFQFINVGVDYMPGLAVGKFGLDTGVTLNF